MGGRRQEGGGERAGVRDEHERAGDVEGLESKPAERMQDTVSDSQGTALWYSRIFGNSSAARVRAGPLRVRARPPPCTVRPGRDVCQAAGRARRRGRRRTWAMRHRGHRPSCCRVRWQWRPRSPRTGPAPAAERRAALRASATRRSGGAHLALQTFSFLFRLFLKHPRLRPDLHSRTSMYSRSSPLYIPRPRIYTVCFLASKPLVLSALSAHPPLTLAHLPSPPGQHSVLSVRRGGLAGVGARARTMRAMRTARPLMYRRCVTDAGRQHARRTWIQK